MPDPNTPLLSCALSPRDRALKIKTTFFPARFAYKPSTHEHEEGPYNAKHRTNSEQKEGV